MVRKRGFTLIELLVVIAIIGILATLVVTQLQGARIRARNTQAKSDVNEMDKSIALFKQEDAAGELPVSARTTAAGTTLATSTSPSFAPASTCVSKAGAAAACLSEVVGKTTTLDTAFGVLFTGSLSTTTSPYTYGLRITKTPAASYYYYYMTTDTAVPSAANGLSVSPEYAVVADLGTSGATTDGVARFYAIKASNMVAVSSGTNVTGSGTGATEYRPSFVPTASF